MSDVSQPSAPPPSAPVNQTPSAPQQAEVPVSEAPVGSPTPLGDQAPPKPPGQESDKSSRMGRREAIENAFARAKQDQEAAAKELPKRARPGSERPGMGHNQPPEPMEKAAEAKKPVEKPTAAQAAERYREAGKFARDPAKPAPETPQTPQTPQSGQQPGQQQPQQGQQPPQPQQLDKRAPYREPPGRFSEQAKTEWAAAPESVRGAVYTMAKEFSGAYERFRGDHEAMEDIRPYHELCTKQGTTMRKAFDNYYSMEQKLRQDLIGGLDVLVQNLARGQNLRKSDGSLLNLQDVAHHIVSMTPEQHQLAQQRNHQSSAEMRIQQLNQQVGELSQGMGQLLYQQRFSSTRSEVDKFAETHPRFDELADLVKSELDLGFPLEVAYKRAEMLRPNPQATHAAQTRTHSAQTRKTSISGAPDGNGKSAANTRPSDGQRKANGEAKHPSRREAIAKAMRRVGNGV